MSANNFAVDDEIYDCLNLDNPKSFFLFAGAGSGKTRTLVNVLTRFKKNNIEKLRRTGRRVAVITYTNAACDEIKRRLEFDSSFYISTIHSFSWELIHPYTNDIKNYLTESLQKEIDNLEEKQRNARNQKSKTYLDRTSKIDSKEKRLSALSSVKKFTYNPNGDNVGKDSLSHAEVIKIAAFFIQKKQLMQNILVGKFPILLIDESQDTKKELVDAFFKLQREKSGEFSLGMFGDTMQRIYSDGKVDLGTNIPADWARPEKRKNYRCPRRIISLINKIRNEVDQQEQESVKTDEGFVRLFVVDTNNDIKKLTVESNAAKKMWKITNDPSWNPEQGNFKTLTLEHHMAAKRGEFSSFFDPLYKVILIPL